MLECSIAGNSAVIIEFTHDLVQYLLKNIGKGWMDETNFTDSQFC